MQIVIPWGFVWTGREKKNSRGVEGLGQAEAEIGGLGEEGLLRGQVVRRQQSTEHPDRRLKNVHVLPAGKKKND